jgi:hypothetical protein
MGFLLRLFPYCSRVPPPEKPDLRKSVCASMSLSMPCATPFDLDAVVESVGVASVSGRFTNVVTLSRQLVVGYSKHPLVRQANYSDMWRLNQGGGKVSCRGSTSLPAGSGHATNGCRGAVSDKAVSRHQQFRDLPFAVGSERKF